MKKQFTLVASSTTASFSVDFSFKCHGARVCKRETTFVRVTREFSWVFVFGPWNVVGNTRCRGERSEKQSLRSVVHEPETEGLSAPPSVAGAQSGGAPDLRPGTDAAADGLRPLLLGRNMKRRGSPPLPPLPEPGMDEWR